MPNMTLAVPEELHKVMKSHPEIKWSEIARQAMKDYAVKLEVLDDLVSQSTFTENDVREIGDAAKRDLAARYKKAASERRSRRNS